MYSLYRAWFGDASMGDTYPRFQGTLSPPDTVVRVGNEGEHQFVAHKGVLAAHSGYLKALLTSASPSNGSSTGSQSYGSCDAMSTVNVSMNAGIGQATRQPVTSVSVSSIGGEAFAPLLNYMYTGRLEVTLDNVYSVLLATHLLHMPGALEQCRAALLRLRAQAPLPTPMPVPPPAPVSTSTSTSTSGSGNILRPIPNRLVVGPPLCWPQPSPLYPSTASASVGIPHLPQLQPSVLMQPSVPSSISVIPAANAQETQDSSARYSGSSEISRSPKSSPSQTHRNHGRQRSRSRSPPEAVSSVSLPFVAAAAAAFTAFATSNTTPITRGSSPSQSASPSPPSSKSPSPLRRRKADGRSKDHREQEDSRPRQPTPQYLGGRSTSEETSSNHNRSGDSGSETVSMTDGDRARSSRRRGRANSNDASGILSVVYDVACCDGPVRFHRVLNENYSVAGPGGTLSQSRIQRPCTEGESASENDENGGPGVPVDATGEAGNGTGSYTCGYCRHTFKSQYCYRKHAKRHLLPTRVNDAGANRQQRQENGTRGRREVRLLDLNVQYYPCKICGCKFPSYYFVHKHRKLCHANAEERPSNREVGGTETMEQEVVVQSTSEDS